ncbi:hypothetical protein C9374_002423 [Naegleria lovaniensis]|uniref:Uncharacterized protein n=1 Tax=Naegleria lovaniensis TaxID=51637 RepID=A0AA88KM83_NAELO|nr:uncharacterized protein C9374_002423 [Naegleria lovaniensis]KAG2386679.1 hypothetical protein C9374_002423 [Naegleria lovaniensis]
MFNKQFPSSSARYGINDRVGSGFFYDRYYTRFKSPKWRAILLCGAAILLWYYPSKFIYRFVFEHPYWERRQIRKEQEREIKQLVLMSSNRDRKETLNEMFKEYYIGKYLEQQEANQSTSQQQPSEPNTEEILQNMIIKWYGITNSDHSELSREETSLSSSSPSTISRIIHTSELFNLSKR